jgi:hypothetical protein
MTQFMIIASSSLLIVLTGCSTERIADYQPGTPSISERTVENMGVQVALDPFVEHDRTEKYFDIDAVAEGIAILHVRIANKTADQTFLIEKDDFQLLPDGIGGGSTTADGQKIERSQAAGTAVEITGAVLSGLGGSALFLGGLASVSLSTEIQRNFTAKEMADATLSPGKCMDGFIYFSPVKEGEDWSRTAAATIHLTETKTGHVLQLNVPFSH